VSLYAKLAWNSMRNNRKFYLPYFLTCVGTVMMFYIMAYLADGPLFLQTLPMGYRTMSAILELGRIVMALFSLIFLAYTYAFLVRRRNAEFGLYHILGMAKGNIARLLLWETLILGGGSLLTGIGLGVLFSKMAELLLFRMVKTDVTYAFSLDATGIVQTLILFGVIFTILMVVSMLRIAASRPLDLMKSEAAGERPPRANWFLALLGLLILGAAYFIAVSIQDPVQALTTFFIAVIMVIIGTYLLLIAGSVTLCRALQKSAGYYRLRRFISTSLMAFRMKRNGAGLATICILSTMVLVMLSSTSALYFGGEQEIRKQFPNDVTVSVTPKSYDFVEQDGLQPIRDVLQETLGDVATHVNETVRIGFSADLAGDVLTQRETYGVSWNEMASNYYVNLYPLEEYTRVTGETVELAPGQALCAVRNAVYRQPALELENLARWELVPIPADKAEAFPTEQEKTFLLFVPDFKEAAETILPREDDKGILDGGYPLARLHWDLRFDLDVPVSEQPAKLETFADGFWDLFATEEVDGVDVARGPYAGEDSPLRGYGFQSYSDMLTDFVSMFGSLFFLGILLSVVFLAAATLIIYYKQLSEGYEDQGRFEIMQKLGLRPEDIRASVNTQLLTVFFLPLVFAVLHLAFAFPMVQKMLSLFAVSDARRLWITAGVSVALFSLFYVAVYFITSRVYYKIVREEEREQA